MSGDGFFDVGGAVFMEEGMNVEGVGRERAIGWTGVWLNVSRQEDIMHYVSRQPTSYLNWFYLINIKICKYDCRF